MRIICVLALVVLGCLFPALLMDAIKMEPKEAGYQEKRYQACACFGGILLLLVFILS